MYIIGITGPVGSGKTTIAKQIETIFGDVSILSMDNYFKAYSNLSLEDRKKINFDVGKSRRIGQIFFELCRTIRAVKPCQIIFDFHKFSFIAKAQAERHRQAMLVRFM